MACSNLVAVVFITPWSCASKALMHTRACILLTFKNLCVQSCVHATHILTCDPLRWNRLHKNYDACCIQKNDSSVFGHNRKKLVKPIAENTRFWNLNTTCSAHKLTHMRTHHTQYSRHLLFVARMNARAHVHHMNARKQLHAHKHACISHIASAQTHKGQLLVHQRVWDIRAPSQAMGSCRHHMVVHACRQMHTLVRKSCAPPTGATNQPASRMATEGPCSRARYRTCVHVHAKLDGDIGTGRSNTWQPTVGTDLQHLEVRNAHLLHAWARAFKHVRMHAHIVSCVTATAKMPVSMALCLHTTGAHAMMSTCTRAVTTCKNTFTNAQASSDIASMPLHSHII